MARGEEGIKIEDEKMTLRRSRGKAEQQKQRPSSPGGEDRGDLRHGPARSTTLAIVAARSDVTMAGLLLLCLLGRHGRGLLVRGGWIWGLGVAGSSSSCSSAASTPRSNAVAGGRGHLLSFGSGEEGWGRSSPRLHALDLV